MAINVIDNNRVGNQAMTVAMNQGMNQALDQISQVSDFQKGKKTEKFDPIKQALDPKNKKDLGISLIQDFFSKAGISRSHFQGHRPGRQAERAAQDELKQMLGQTESLEDNVQLTRSAASGLISRMYANKNEATRTLKPLSGEQTEEVSGETSGGQKTGSSSGGHRVGAVTVIGQRKGSSGGGEQSSDGENQSGDGDNDLNSENLNMVFKNILSRLQKAYTQPGSSAYRGNGSENSNQSPSSTPTPREVTAMLKEYAGLFMEYLVANDPEVYTKLKEIEGRLRSMGVLERDLIEMQLALRHNVRSQIAGGIQKNLVGKFLSEENQVDTAIFERNANDWIEQAFHNDKLGGWDFGNFHSSLQGTSDEMGKRALDEVADFLTDELESTLIKKVFTGVDLKNDKEIKEFLKVSRNTGFDPLLWVQKVWPQKRLHYGLNLYDVERLENQKHLVVAYDGDPLIYQNSTGQGDKKRDEKYKKTYEVSDSEDKDVLVARLRALYMRRIMEPGVKTFFETMFEMKKTRGGLIKLGIFTPQLDKQLKKEARVMVRAQYFGSLQQSLMERATLYETKGTAYSSVESHLKGILKNASRAGLEVSSREFEELVDFSNRSMFDVGKSELENVFVMKQVRSGSKMLENKEKLLLKLLERLANESKLEFNVAGFYQTLHDKYIESKKVSISGV